jgi:predicted phosphodiesterase
MKIVTIGDIHGKNVWKKIVDDNPADKIIFVGDYVDDFVHSNVKILSNLKDIIDFKANNPDKVILLLGNHDFQYLFFPEYRCQGFRAEAYPDLYDAFYKNRDLFQIAWSYNKFLWTHAGVNEIWYEKHLKGSKNIVEDLNDMIMTRPGRDALGSEIGKRGMFSSGFGSPLWSDKKETLKFPIDGWHQIVGHTRVDMITIEAFSSTCSITYVDCLKEIHKGVEPVNEPLILSL